MVKIFVGNLNPSSKSAELRKKFEKFGKVVECDIVNNYAFVHMDNETDAKSAISALHNSDFDGSKINVEHSHGKRGGPNMGPGPGPMRRRFDQRRGPRDYPPDNFRGPPRNYMGGPPPNPRDRYSQPGWDGYGPAPYPPMRPADRGGYDYPPNGPGSRYPPEPVRIREGRAPPPLMIPEAGYRGSPREPMPPRDYPPKERSRYDSYDGYGAESYERYREPAPVPPAHPRQDYYDSYGGYPSSNTAAGGNYDYPDYRDSRPSSGAPSSYNNSYEYGGYYDYPREGRSAAPPQPPPPSRSGYSYGRP